VSLDGPRQESSVWLWVKGIFGILCGAAFLLMGAGCAFYWVPDAFRGSNGAWNEIETLLQVISWLTLATGVLGIYGGCRNIKRAIASGV